MNVRVSATEVARNLSDLLNRVRYRGERFTVVRGGEDVAEIGPPAGGGVVTLGELRRVLAALASPDDDFSTDLETIRAAQPPAEPTWRS
jgi:antitoxin (DNA-binding transcriptional repressor) of toxin-antitoxin stability system